MRRKADWQTSLWQKGHLSSSFSTQAAKRVLKMVDSKPDLYFTWEVSISRSLPPFEEGKKYLKYGWNANQKCFFSVYAVVTWALLFYAFSFLNATRFSSLAVLLFFLSLFFFFFFFPFNKVCAVKTLFLVRLEILPG